ncbi:methyltransferase [Marinimicrobium sp. C6131]|uniref:class I SAM-dependent methyltransferase n=1 Tax=Marinimicrobium sp. C6131 TaxID=3022676 RepID=UPI00223E507C|nr:methyltransferase [Marinimicrobium sp. C6131]UZJ44986.1 methyltransferase [Marinimicrobium sp. C6131]
MKILKLVACLAAATALTACDQAEETQTATPEPEPEATISDGAPLAAPGASILEIMASAHRSDENRARDRYRNPEETLFFFGLEPDDTVIEINPGGGWYMEIIAPFVNEDGQYIAATPDPELEGMPSYVIRQAAQIQARIEEQPDFYGNADVQLYDPSAPVLGEPGSADFVLTFRNVHGWINGGQAEGMFQAFADVLKPGGVLGVVQHRAVDDADPSESAATGYVSEAAVIALAEAAGLTLDDRSNINANPKDTRDHPEGVWTLPPSLRLGEENRAAYEAIGESDRMTLRFVKPESAE